MENQYDHEELLLNMLGAHLDTFKQMGASLQEAVHSFQLPGGQPQARRFGAGLNWQGQVRVESLVDVVSAHYGGLSAQELAIELKEDFRYDAAHIIKGVLSRFRKLKAAEICGIMLHVQVCPEFAADALALGKLLKANPVVSYDEQDLLAALSQNYPGLSQREVEDDVAEIFGKKKRGPIAALAGTYTTDTQWWGEYFSPLVIREDCTVTLGASAVKYTYNEDTKNLRFEHEASPGAVCWGDVSFAGDGLSFAGGLQPRPQDGGVNFKGTKQ